MTAQITARQIRSMALSVATARRLGIQTTVAEQAPMMLSQAEKVLETMCSRTKKLTPSAPSMGAENRYYDAVSKTVAYEAAVKELRAALGVMY